MMFRFQVELPLDSVLRLPLLVLDSLNNSLLSLNPKLLLSRKKHPGIIRKDNSAYHLPGKCFLKILLFSRPPALINAPFHLQSFCLFLLICLWVGTELSPVSGSSLFPQPRCLCLTSTSLLSRLKHLRIKLNILPAACWYLKKKLSG